ncbi:MAG: MFS transporter, partial [Dehalococcoidia bacterium]
ITLLAGGVAAGFHEPPRGRGAHPNALRTMRNAVAMVWHRPPLRCLLGFSAAITAASFVPIIFVQPFLAHYHTSVGAYGLLQTPGRLLDIVAALVAYRVARALSARGLLVWLTLWLCATTVMVAAWQSPLAFVAFPLMALGFGGANPVLSDCLNRIIPSSERATVLSLGHVIDGLILIGFEPALGAAAQSHGISAAFVGAAAFLVLAGAVTLLPYVRASRPAYAPVETIA